MKARASGPAGTAVAIFYIFLWASAYVPSKVAAVESDPFWFLVFRFATAGAVLAVLALALRRPFPTAPRRIGIAALVGVLANAGYLGFSYLALRHLSSGMGAIVASTNPLVLSLIAPKLLGERLTPPKIAGLLLGFGGVVAIVLSRTGTGTAAPRDVLLAFAGVCASVASTVLFKRFAAGLDLLAMTSIQLLASSIVLAPIAFAASGLPHIRFTPELIASFGYLVAILSVGASLIWFWLLSHGEASRVSAYYYLTPAFGLALSALVLHEAVQPRDAFGLAAIALGIALVQRSPATLAPQLEAATTARGR